MQLSTIALVVNEDGVIDLTQVTNKLHVHVLLTRDNE